jgi:Leucine-rich repeat (LRR) protein
MLTDFCFDEPPANVETCCLKVLDLSGNQLDSLPNRSVSNFPPSLVRLDLRYNKIVDIESGAFEDLVNLRSLDLARNPIATLDLNNILNNDTCNLRLLNILGCSIINVLWKDFSEEKEEGANAKEKRKRSEVVSKFPVKCLRNRVLFYVNESQNNLSHEVLNKLVDERLIKLILF